LRWNAAPFAPFDGGSQQIADGVSLPGIGQCVADVLKQQVRHRRRRLRPAADRVDQHITKPEPAGPPHGQPQQPGPDPPDVPTLPPPASRTRPAALTLTRTSLDAAASFHVPPARRAELVDMRSAPGWVLRKFAHTNSAI
jgi:hypothetical protein